MKQSGRGLHYWSGTAKYFAVKTRLQMFLNAFHTSQQADEIHSPLLFWQDMTAGLWLHKLDHCKK